MSSDVLERLNAHRARWAADAKSFPENGALFNLVIADLNLAIGIIEEKNAEIERLRASQKPVCQHSWHKLAERMVTGCGNETDSVGAFCQFCGGKVEVV